MRTFHSILALLLLGTSLSGQVASPGCVRSYTDNVDFDEGLLLSVNHSVPGSLRLDQPGQPLPFVNIACSGRGTVVRVDVQTGVIVGEYQTAPNDRPKDPSRTTVDKYGSVWVTNRAESGTVNGVPMGSVTRIGIILGGTRCDASGANDPNGQYLKPPFLYNTCIDRDGDGLIKTSWGLGNILPWNNPGGVNTNGGVSGAEDEAVITFTRVLATGARTIAIDEFNNAWVGGSTNHFHEKLDGSTGLPIPGTAWNIGAGGYGGFIDGNGVLWSAGATDAPLVRFDPSGAPFPATMLIPNAGDYGLGVDPNTGEIWSSDVNNGLVYKISPAGAVIGSYPYGHPNSQGLAVDALGNVWVAHSILGPSTTVGHLRTDGTFVGNVTLPGAGPTGVAVDAFGKVWVTCYNSDLAVRIDPNAGPIGGGGYPVGAVDLTVPLGAGAAPYNYSDMTGFVVINSTVPSGTWTVVHDGLAAGRKWGNITWNDSVPAQTGIRVEARASDNLLTLAANPFVEVEKGVSFCCAGVTGRYVEIRTTLFRQATVNITPVLYDLTIQCCDTYPNTLPTIASSIGCGTADTLRVPAGEPLSFTVTGADVDAGQDVELDAIGLPTGASMDPVLPAGANPFTSTFEWTPTLAQLGVYDLAFTANDVYCYEATCDVVIEVVPCPSVSCSGTGISCVGLCNATAEVMLSSDPGGFTFTWNTTPPTTGAQISGLCPGEYTVYSTNNAACQDSCTIVVPAEPCDGFRTHTQGGYGSTPNGSNPGKYVKQNFNAVFPNGLTIGCIRTLRLTSWQAVIAFLPCSGTPTALPVGHLVNPTTYKNTFAGQLVAAKLNMAFDSANVNFAPATQTLGELVLAAGPLAGYTVREVIAIADLKIGGCGGPITFSTLTDILTNINQNYQSGTANNCYLSCPLSGSGGLRSIAVVQTPGFSWNLQPNPASDQVQVRLAADRDMALTIDLLDASGRLSGAGYRGMAARGADQLFSLSLGALDAGVYFVRVTNGTVTETQRLLIVR